MLADIPEVQVAGEAATGLDAMRMIALTSADVLLLDISMPGLDGMSLARILQQKESGQESTPAIIFCTAWSDQAVEAFECDAVDYLVKPVRAERLVIAINKAKRHLAKTDSAKTGPLLRSTLAGKVNLLAMSDVIYLYAEDKCTMAVHVTGRQVINKSLRELEKLYPETLVRVHRGALVASNRIRGLEKTSDGTNFLLLDKCDERIKVSRRKLPAIRKIIRGLA